MGDTKTLMAELRLGVVKLLHAIENEESMSAKDWMAYYDQCFKVGACGAPMLCRPCAMADVMRCASSPAL